MNCPNCGTLEQARVRVCPSCGIAYASQDLLELRQLEFLLRETAGWTISKGLREPYAERLLALKARVLPAPPALAPTVPAVTGPIMAAPVMPAAPAVEALPVAPAPPVMTAPARPKPEPVPFDQWLLSERNIKLALYSGGLLLLFAGLIFVGVNWGRIPGLLKFATTMTATGLMYLGGTLLFRRPALRLGGVALLGIASGFVPLNFAVLQIYIFSSRGLSSEAMWLIGSAPAAFLYAFTAYRTREHLFIYLSLGAVASAATATLALVHAPLLVYPLAYSLLALAFLLCARGLQETRLAGFTRTPLLVVSQLAAYCVFGVSAFLWDTNTGCTACSDGSPWLALGTMLIGVIFYVTTDLALDWILARWSAAIAFAFTSYLALTQLNLSAAALMLTLMVMAVGYLLASSALERRALKGPAGFTRAPLLVISQAAAPFLFIGSAVYWELNKGCAGCAAEGPWLALGAMVAGVAYYVIADLAFGWILARWASAFAFAFSFILLLRQLEFSSVATGITLLALALAYLVVGYLVARRKDKLAGWPLYAAGYAVAAFVTVLALIGAEGHLDDLAKTLIGDAVLLAVSAVVHRRYNWVYGAVWMLMAPVYIYANLYLPWLPSQGLVLGGLMLMYVAAGYGVGRRARRLAGPFLSAAALLSLIVPSLAWSDTALVSLALGAISVLYVLVAVWLRGSWSWLLLPAMVALNVTLFAVLRIVLTPASPWERVLPTAYGALGVVLTLCGAGLRWKRGGSWGLPLYLVAVADLAAAYLVGLYLGGALAIRLSAVLAVLALFIAWVELAAVARLKLPPVLSYLGLLFVFAGQFYVLNLSAPALHNWPAFTAGLCALMLGVAALLRRGYALELYGIPARRTGLVMMLAPMVGAVIGDDPLLAAAAFAIATATYAADAAARRLVYLGYLAGATFITSLWAVLLYFKIEEWQAYVLPLGLGLLIVGWNERRRGVGLVYSLATAFGLLALLGASFYQSFDSIIYAVLLSVESLLAVIWGVRTHSRIYVQLGVLSLIANAVAQLGPGFVELPRWIQLGLIGTILLGGGIIGLFQRERILAARRAVVDEWRTWQA